MSASTLARSKATVQRHQAFLLTVNLPRKRVSLSDAIYRLWVLRIVECTLHVSIMQLNWSRLSGVLMKVGLALRMFRGSTPTSVLPCLSGLAWCVTAYFMAK
jgi:hypothetical protein